MEINSMPGPAGKASRAKAGFRAGRVWPLPACNGWAATRALSICCALLPLLALTGGLFSSPGPYWEYVRDHLLRAYFTETFLVTAGAGLGALLLGVSLAWAISMYDFSGKKFFEAALVLPLAIPPYIAAYAYEGLLGYTGSLQSFLRNSLGLRPFALSEQIPAQAWAIWIFSVTLFPYVYILTRTFLRHQSAALFENALLLGGGSGRLFLRVGLPLLWPSAAAGLILVCLETLNDFGVASYYGLNTFTTAIFAAWFGMGDADTAVKLALILLTLVFMILLARKAAHKSRRYHIVSSREKRLLPRRAQGARRSGIILLCSLAWLAGFAAPVSQLLYWLRLSWKGAFTVELAQAALYTLGLAGGAALLIMTAATGTANANRLFGGRVISPLSQGACLGYAIPSAVLAIGVISLFIWVDNILASLLTAWPARFFSMGSGMLLFAYSARFFSIGYQAVEAGFAKTGLIYTEASRSLGRGVSATFFLVDLPLLRHALISGSALVFIDILKELPLSLLLRPFNTETLSTTVYHFVKNEVLEETALPSLLIISAGALFLLFMQAWGKEARHVPEN